MRVSEQENPGRPLTGAEEGLGRPAGLWLYVRHGTLPAPRAL